MCAYKTLDYECEFKNNARDFRTNEYLLLGAGPCNITERTMRAFSRQPLIPLSNDMYKMMDKVKNMLQYVFQTKNRLTLASQTSGNGGNETIIANLLDPGDRLIVAIGGAWGEIAVNIGKRYNLDILSLRKPAGEVFSNEELENAIRTHKAKLLFIVHGESTGGIIQKLEDLGAICHKYNCLLAVDAVVSLGADPLFVDRWALDAVCAGSQKAIGAPPGACLLTFSPRAEKCMKEKKVQPPYYLDMNMLGSYWNCFDDIRKYQYTFSSNMVAALHEALAQICEEGLINVWERHKFNTELFWQRLDEIGLKCFVQNKENRFFGVTCVNVPPDINQQDLLQFLQEKYSIVITRGFGPTLNKAIRVGFLGPNSTTENVEYLCEALKAALKFFRQ